MEKTNCPDFPESSWEREFREYEENHLGRERDNNETGIYYYAIRKTGEIIRRRKGDSGTGDETLGTGEYRIVPGY